MLKKIISFLTATATLFCFAGCNANTENKEGTIKIVTTIFPEYDWVREITKGSENVDITFMLDSGVDLHSYQPSSKDIATICSSDIFIYSGGTSDKWINDALAEASNENLVAINLIDELGNNAKTEEVVDGMEADDDDDADEIDEHVWLSLKNAEFFVDKIANCIAEKDTENKQLYLDNAKNYEEELSKVDTEYQEAVDSSQNHTLVFGDRFPFRYMTDDYNLEYFAAFNGCSAESEASFQTITFLCNKLDELNLDKICVIDGSDQSIADTIIKNSDRDNVEIVEFNSMQSVTEEDVSAGTTYISLEEENLEALKTALN